MNNLQRMLVGIGAGAIVVLGMPGCARDSYSIHDFRRALGERWEGMPVETRQGLKEKWGDSDFEMRKFFIELYKDPVKCQKDYGLRDPKVSKEDLIEYGKNMHWMNPNKPTLADMILIDQVRGIEFLSYGR